jgi:SAM-dependent methyltransferase
MIAKVLQIPAPDLSRSCIASRVFAKDSHLKNFCQLYVYLSFKNLFAHSLSSYKEKKISVLDAASQAWLFRHTFNDYDKHIRYVGLDYELGRFKQAREMGRIKEGDIFLLADLTKSFNIPLIFDLTLSFNTISHIPERHFTKVLENLCSFVRPGGTLLFNAPYTELTMDSLLSFKWGGECNYFLFDHSRDFHLPISKNSDVSHVLRDISAPVHDAPYRQLMVYFTKDKALEQPMNAIDFSTGNSYMPAYKVHQGRSILRSVFKSESDFFRAKNDGSLICISDEFSRSASGHQLVMFLNSLDREVSGFNVQSIVTLSDLYFLIINASIEINGLSQVYFLGFEFDFITRQEPCRQAFNEVADILNNRGIKVHIAVLERWFNTIVTSSTLQRYG